MLILFNFRPAIPGEINGEILLFLYLLLTFLYLLLFRSDFKIRVSLKYIVQYILILIFMSYLLTQSSLLQVSNMRPVINSFILILILTTSYIFVYNNNLDTKFLLKTLVFFITVLSISQLITYLMFILDIEFTLTSIQTHQGIANRIKNVYFPFTIAGGEKHKIFQFVLTRANGFFREPGIYQMYINLAFFSLDFIKIKYKNLFRLLFIFSLFTTFSTTGLIIFWVCLLYKFFLYFNINLSLKKIFLIIIFIILLILMSYYILFTSSFGLVHRLRLNSGQFRLLQIKRGIDLFLEYPIFGTGYYNQVDNVSTVTFLSGFYTIGIVGVFLYLLNWIYSIIFFSKPITHIIYIPVFMTLLFAQPIYTEFIVFLILIIDKKKLEYVK
jgi:hypothetical protein